MKRLLRGCLLLFVLVASALASEPSTGIVRACVAAESSFKAVAPPNSTAETREQRDLLVSYLNHQKPPHNIKIEAVALTAMGRQAVDTEARQKDCTYTVMLSLAQFQVAPDSDGQGQKYFMGPGVSFAPASLGEQQVITATLHKTSNGEAVVGDGCGGYAPRSAAAMNVANCVFKLVVKASAP